MGEYYPAVSALAGGSDKQDRLFVMAHVRFNQQRLVVFDQGDVVVAGYVGIVGCNDSGPVKTWVEFDGCDATTRDGAANCFSEKHSIKADIIDITSLSCELFKAFLA